MAAAGCGGGPARVAAPSWDPEKLTAAVFASLDANNDDLLDRDELEAAPGLRYAHRYLDTDGDGQLGREEIRQRFALYQELRVGTELVSLRVTLNGRPLRGATVRLIPEAFLEGVIEPASGTTDEYGIASPTIEGASLPGIRIGFYRAEIVSPQLQSAQALRSAESLGIEVSPISDDVTSSGTLELALKG
jgi:hypothetical protein